MGAKRNLFIVVSAPSGAGKSTLCRKLLAERPDVMYSVSCTTRPPRGREEEGREYFFLSGEEFTRRVAEGEFLEHAVVHGYRYGTLRSTVEQGLKQGRSVLLDIDVQGARQVREHLAGSGVPSVLRSGFIDIFIVPPDLRTLEQRLRARGEDTEAEMARRLENARQEMAARCAYRYVVVNDTLGRAYGELKRIVECEERGQVWGGRARRMQLGAEDE